MVLEAVFGVGQRTARYRADTAPASSRHGRRHGGDFTRWYDYLQEQIPEFHDTIHFRELKNFVFVSTTTDFTGIGEALGLLRLSRNCSKDTG